MLVTDPSETNKSHRVADSLHNITEVSADGRSTRAERHDHRGEELEIDWTDIAPALWLQRKV